MKFVPIQRRVHMKQRLLSMGLILSASTGLFANELEVTDSSPAVIEEDGKVYVGFTQFDEEERPIYLNLGPGNGSLTWQYEGEALAQIERRDADDVLLYVYNVDEDHTLLPPMPLTTPGYTYTYHLDADDTLLTRTTYFHEEELDTAIFMYWGRESMGTYTEDLKVLELRIFNPLTTETYAIEIEGQLHEPNAAEQGERERLLQRAVSAAPLAPCIGVDYTSLCDGPDALASYALSTLDPTEDSLSFMDPSDLSLTVCAPDNYEVKFTLHANQDGCGGSLKGKCSSKDNKGGSTSRFLKGGMEWNKNGKYSGILQGGVSREF